MSISIIETAEPDQVMVVVVGETSVEEMMQFIATHRGGGEREFAFLLDVSDASINVSGDEMRQIATYAAQEARKAPMGPVAFIASNPGPFGVTRMYQAYSTAAGRNNVGVFRTVEDAQAWLRAFKA